jgi:OOP family OmpA-OmpF porin
MKKIIPAISLFFILGFAFTGNDYKIDNNELILPSPIVFKAGTAELKPESDSALFHIKNYLNDKTYITVLRIEAHTGNAGDEAKNQLLSCQRALAVGKWLGNNGIDCSRLICVGFGSTKPKEGNETPEGRAANERISVFNAELRKVRIGGMPLDGGGQKAGDPCK